MFLSQCSFRVLLCLALSIGSLLSHANAQQPTTKQLSAEILRDKIRGGLLGQMLGNLNGLPHEMRYIVKPGNVTGYVPALPKGAWTDDDTDFEWVYIVEMQKRRQILLPPSRLRQLWQKRINRRIWCSNQYARQLMDLGLEPPLTGRFALNPWADFNISGQFLCETFGLIAPGMPQTASRIGLNYTQVAIDLEPAQTTQLFTTMISTAFLTEDIDKILDAGLRAVDKKSKLHGIIGDVRKWHRENPKDWRKTRELVKNKYTKHGGKMRDRNGYELNTASTIAALLYGKGDFAKTLTMAFNFGWDCDNSAATAGTIVGVTKGYRWMVSQGWHIVDRYQNKTRDNMPQDETITSFADRLVDLAELVITERGGRRVFNKGQPFYVIPIEKPKNIAPLPDLKRQIRDLRKNAAKDIEQWLLRGKTKQEKARAVYLAICLDMASGLRKQHPKAWQEGVRALNGYWNVAQVLYYHSPVPAAEALRKKATASGFLSPAKKKRIW